MSHQLQAVCDYSDSDDEFVPPSPVVTRRSNRLQNRDSPWASWSSEKIINTLQAAGIPINQSLSREELLLLAFNTLGSPPADIALDPLPTSAQPKQPGRKQSAKSSSPHPVKKTTSAHPTPNTEDTDANAQLLQAVKSLADTVKGFESRITFFENALAGCIPGVTPSTSLSSSLPASSTTSGSNAPPSTPSTSSGLQLPNQLPANTSNQVDNAIPTTSHFSLSTAVPSQAIGRRFVSPAAVTVSPQIRQNIIQGKDINLASLLLPSPAADRQMVDCGDVAVFLKTSDPRLQRNLSFGEFVLLLVSSEIFYVKLSLSVGKS
ncbi:hypothetical protein QQF64_018892 [Cirrhinus molitorella]|uniref:Uncharacterized protein n=1 Tax=Cirrhinus molitorella TaxID=172907 RepID=A0ABR3LGH4_9TELE